MKSAHPIRRKQNGNFLAEMAVVFVPLFALLFGFVDFGLAIFLRSTFQSAVAAGVRYGVTMQTVSGFGMNDSIRLVTQANALGFLGDTTYNTPNRAQITVQYYNPNGSMLTPLPPGNANQPLNVLEVTTAGYNYNWVTLLSGTWALRNGTPVSITAYSSDRLGALPTGAVPPPE